MGPTAASELTSSNPSASATPPANTPLKNWAGNLTYSTSNVHYPTSVEEVQAVVRGCQKLRVLGSRHSFNRIADSAVNLVSLQEMKRVVALDKTAHTITVEAGVRYGDIAPYLEENGYALPNLASLPHITVVGACATATHGSGVNHGSLASSVSALEFVSAGGDVVTLSRKRDGEQFLGAVVNLGALGVITRMTLDLVPTFQMQQVVYLDLPMEALPQNFEAIQAEGYSVSLFTDWTAKNIGEVWIKSKTVEDSPFAAASELFGARLASETVHPIAGQSAENVTEQRGIPGSWYDRLPHFKMGFKPSAGAELQSEFFVPIQHAYEALTALEKLHERLTPSLYISEIRTVAADDLWLSPFYQRPSVAFHFTWKQDIEAVMRLIPLIEESLAPYGPRPHWGKLFTMPPALLQQQYERLDDFRQLALRYDPAGKFRNEYLDRNIFGQAPAFAGNV
jgi:alditol oxidase